MFLGFFVVVFFFFFFLGCVLLRYVFQYTGILWDFVTVNFTENSVVLYCVLNFKNTMEFSVDKKGLVRQAFSLDNKCGMSRLI